MSQPPRRQRSPDAPETSAAGEASLGSASPRSRRSHRPSTSPGAASPSSSPRRASAARRGATGRSASGVPSRTRAEQDEAWARLVESGKVALATSGMSSSNSAPQLQGMVEQDGGSSMLEAGGASAGEDRGAPRRRRSSLGLRRAAARSSTSPGVSADPGSRPEAEASTSRAWEKRRASPGTPASSSRAASPRSLVAPRGSARRSQQSAGDSAEPAPKRRRSGHSDYVASPAGSEAATSRQASSRTATPRVSVTSTPGRASLPRPSVAEIAGRRYSLSVLQEPVTGSAFGGSLLSRLAVAPPLVLQLRIIDDLGNEVSPIEELPYLVCHVRLLTDEGLPADMLSPTSSNSSPDRTPQDSAGPSRAGSTQGSQDVSVSSRSVRMLYGTLVSSPLQLPSPSSQDGSPGTFFVFPEVSVRARGRFRLRVLLMRTPDTRHEVPISGSSATVLDTVTTQPLDVLLSADYVAPAITDLTRHFARQGVGLLLPPGAAAD